MVTRSDLEQAFERLGLAGSRAVIHSSLRSFGEIEGGADAVVGAIAGTFDTALLPAFTFDSNAPPPHADRPADNGCDYGFYDNWSKPPVPFRVEDAAIDRTMGVIPRTFAALDHVVRSAHPWHSWIARGPAATNLLEPHQWCTTNVPLDRLAEMGGQVVLIGVGLTSCTAVHTAEERAGRRPFIRWAYDREGVVRRARVAGCSKGFAALEPYVEDLFRETPVGQARIRVAPLTAMLDRLAAVIREQPMLTVHSDACLRCRDAARGGPAA
jgi:aminoglycoside 3-N-acetyltransferase